MNRFLLFCFLPFFSSSLISQTYTDVSTSSGVGFTHLAPTDLEEAPMGTGAAWFDFDNDGDLDLYVSARDEDNRFFENNGDGTFTDIASTMGVGNTGGDGAGVSVADINNDGWLDIYLANVDENVLYLNNEGTSFTDITVSAGVQIGAQRSTSGTWGDYDGDGYLDLYVSHHVPHFDTPEGDGSVQDYLFHNNGDETFTDVSSLLDIADHLIDPSFIGGWTDYDYDGDLDIILVTDCIFPGFPNEGMKVWRNDGGTDGVTDWTFTEVSDSVLEDDCSNGMGLGVGDYDRDGDYDLVYSDIGPATLWNNVGTVFEQDSTAGATGQALGWFSWGTSFLDFNNDGWLDIIMAFGALSLDYSIQSQPCSLYEAQGDTSFVDVAPAMGLDDNTRTRTIVHGDYDNDGDLDLLMFNYGGEIRLFRNDVMNDNGYLRVHLESRESAPNGIGAKVKVKTNDGIEQSFEVRSGSNLGGGDEIVAHFGLGTATAIEYIKVDWPSGKESCVNHADVNTNITITEPSYLYVRKTATGANNGSSWDDAYNELTDALAAAVAGDEILVADATYYPSPAADETATFIMKDSVAIRGGFPAAGGEFSERDFDAYGTILSGDVGSQTASSAKCYNVISVPATVEGAFIEGVKIADGEADGGSSVTQQGAGMHIEGEVFINEVSLNDHSSTLDGSHICVFGSSGSLRIRSSETNTSVVPTVSCIFIDSAAEMIVEQNCDIKLP